VITVSVIFGVLGKLDEPVGFEAWLTGGFVGGAAQELRNMTLTTKHMARCRTKIALTDSIKSMLAKLFDEYPMLLFVLEAFLALIILLAIVFWTGKGRRE
jgi:hypothetical protein